MAAPPTTTTTPGVSTAAPAAETKKKKPLFSFLNKGAAAAKLEKRQKASKGVKQKYWQKKGYDPKEHTKDLTAGLSVFSSKSEPKSTASGPTDTGPTTISQAFADRDEALAKEEARAANLAHQQELMARLRALTEGQ